MRYSVFSSLKETQSRKNQKWLLVVRLRMSFKYLQKVRIFSFRIFSKVFRLIAKLFIKYFLRFLFFKFICKVFLHKHQQSSVFWLNAAVCRKSWVFWWILRRVICDHPKCAWQSIQFALKIMIFENRITFFIYIRLVSYGRRRYGSHAC